MIENPTGSPALTVVGVVAVFTIDTFGPLQVIFALLVLSGVWLSTFSVAVLS